MERKKFFKELEYKLGIIFKDESLIRIALTHSSYANQKKHIKYNERLEFLGDSVLQLVITEYLFMNYKEKSEGELSKKRALIVCENSLFEIAQKWKLGEYMLMSKGEELTGGRVRASILADCVEAIIAAIYLDRGLEIVKTFIISNFNGIIDRAMKDEIILDYKTKLQEKLQEHGDIDIIYNLEKFEGPPHRRKFYTKVQIEDKILGKGEGYSKKEAEQNAAKEAIKKMEERYE
ncbi:ribonuclease-3 [Clostridium tetanomorphum]|uniref:Ribonuclease 3 n=1 Tax=Clostridium tetanomorphum TaxID=1553 RepID=A0A923EBW6_CLOTT|nr:ribonuclease III [Clostridium tetanomorphum]KAJ51533.1 ribonuclease III [Clostridium tetanomorphum DSM 665]MBC2398886.1 ribonuclease III [Clostridium tetanomorphum]MBP1865181.1 ribonuclease-3 [Clostridium tetanomorphum]NRS84680.1 ribonuclease-3 [Clostridium tetanomorphum]NRZ97895.1 ribonuclease-3 [Clostridium tetanomorphum]